MPYQYYDADGNPIVDNWSNGQNITGQNTNPANAVWRGGTRSANWTPPEYLQTYGNYTGMFPSMGQQVGQALNGSIQAQNYQPAWMQTRLPSRQNNSVDMSKYSPFQSGGRTMANPFPLNGSVNITTPNIGYVNNAGNPFIGAYAGLGGSPGGGISGPTGQTPTSWPGTPYTPSPSPPNPNPPPSPLPSGNTGTPGGQPTGNASNPFHEPAPGSGGPTAPGLSMGGQPYNPGMTPPWLTEPTPGSGGPTIPGMSMGGQPYTGGTAGPGGSLNPNAMGASNPFAAMAKNYNITPQMITGLLGMLGGTKK